MKYFNFYTFEGTNAFCLLFKIMVSILVFGLIGTDTRKSTGQVTTTDSMSVVVTSPKRAATGKPNFYL